VGTVCLTESGSPKLGETPCPDSMLAFSHHSAAQGQASFSSACAEESTLGCQMEKLLSHKSSQVIAPV